MVFIPSSPSLPSNQRGGWFKHRLKPQGGCFKPPFKPNEVWFKPKGGWFKPPIKTNIFFVFLFFSFFCEDERGGGLKGSGVKPRWLRGRRGFTRQPKNSKRSHLSAPPRHESRPQFQLGAPRPHLRSSAAPPQQRSHVVLLASWILQPAWARSAAFLPEGDIMNCILHSAGQRRREHCFANLLPGNRH